MMQQGKAAGIQLAPYIANRFSALDPARDPNRENDATCAVYVSPEGGGRPLGDAVPLYPFQYTSWQEEELSWHDNCYIHSGLNPFPFYTVRGREFIDLLNATCVSTFDNFPVGKARHTIVCDNDGKIVLDGITVRRAEDEFLCMCMLPALLASMTDQKFDVTIDDDSDKRFFYQLCGPRSLEVVEAAAREDLHDIKFMYQRDTKIAGKDVFVLRTGMAGTLGYEVHGMIEDAQEVYAALMDAGKAYDIHELGRHAYRNTHTEGSIPQGGIHFSWGGPLGSAFVSGSAAEDTQFFQASPIDLSWEKMVDLGHEFPGKSAIQAEMEGHHNTLVHLIWDSDDILKVVASYFDRENGSCDMMPMAEDFNDTLSSSQLHLDEVYDGDRLIGASSGRMYSPKNEEMMSLARIDQDYAEEGKRVEVLWGRPGTRQMRIKATVMLAPYIKEGRNDSFDVETIPHPKF